VISADERTLLIIVMNCDEYIEQFHKFTLGKLRKKYHTQQNFKDIPTWKLERYRVGKFRRIKIRDQPTVIKLADGGIIGYRVPAHLVNEKLRHVTPMEKWVLKNKSKLPKTKDERRGLRCVRRYAR
jgi:hypothetical protein